MTLPALFSFSQGELTITSEMEELANALFYDSVPESWTRYAYPSLLSLATWYADLLMRIRVSRVCVTVRAWGTPGLSPPVHWFSGNWFISQYQFDQPEVPEKGCYSRNRSTNLTRVPITLHHCRSAPSPLTTLGVPLKNIHKTLFKNSSSIFCTINSGFQLHCCRGICCLFLLHHLQPVPKLKLGSHSAKHQLCHSVLQLTAYPPS